MKKILLIMALALIITFLYGQGIQVNSSPNPGTTISFSLQENTHVDLSIYNMRGQLVKILFNERKYSGNYKIIWDGRDKSGRLMANGIYFFKLTAGRYTSTRKVVLLK